VRYTDLSEADVERSPQHEPVESDEDLLRCSTPPTQTKPEAPKGAKVEGSQQKQSEADENRKKLSKALAKASKLR
jgi:hypothetical protein